jgi:hypothetical protein
MDREILKTIIIEVSVDRDTCVQQKETAHERHKNSRTT